MIQKLYNLKKTQTEQKLIEKSSLEQEVYKIDEEVGDLNHRINTATVEKVGFNFRFYDFSYAQR